jgi:hypothetical protein
MLHEQPQGFADPVSGLVPAKKVPDLSPGKTTWAGPQQPQQLVRYGVA